MTTRSEQLALIRSKCIEANPNLADGDTFTLNLDGTLLEANVTHGIRLADVLFAIDKYNDDAPALTVEGQFIEWHPESGSMILMGKWWNLRKDNLTQQSNECIAFLYDLLH